MTEMGVISISRAISNMDRNSERKRVDMDMRTGEKKCESNDVGGLRMGDLKREVEPSISSTKTGVGEA